MTDTSAPPAVVELPETFTIAGRVLTRHESRPRAEPVTFWSGRWSDDHASAGINAALFLLRFGEGYCKGDRPVEWQCWLATSLTGPTYESVTLIEVRGNDVDLVIADMDRRLKLLRPIFAPAPRARRSRR